MEVNNYTAVYVSWNDIIGVTLIIKKISDKSSKDTKYFFLCSLLNLLSN